MAKLELYLTAAGYKSSVKLDGQEVPGCKSVRLRARAGQVTTAIIEVLCVDGATVTCEDAEVLTEISKSGPSEGNAK